MTQRIHTTPGGDVRIVTATVDMKRDIMAVAKQSKYTRDFSNHMFSGDDHFEKGWIRVACKDSDGGIIGFTCVRHKVRQPETTLYFIGVDKDHQQLGIGTVLLADVMAESPHPRIILGVMNDNEGALAFYERHGFTVVEPCYQGKGVRLVKEWNR